MKRRKMAIFADVKQKVIKEEESKIEGPLEEDVDTTTMVTIDDDFITHYSNGTFKIAKRGEMNTKPVANSSLVVDKIKEWEFVVTKIPNPEVIHEDIIIPLDIADFQLSAPTEIKVEPILAADIELEKDKKQKQKLKEEEEESRMNLKITTPPTMRLLALREIKPLAYVALRKDDSLTFAGALAKVSKELGFANYEFYVLDYCNSKSA